VNRPLQTEFTYLVPEHLRDRIKPGQRVRVPFGKGNRPFVGYCVAVMSAPDGDRQLKSIESIIDPEPLLSPKMLELTRWIADYYVCGWGQAFDVALPRGVKRSATGRLTNFFRASSTAQAEIDQLHLPPKQRAVLDVLQAGNRPMQAGDLMEAAGCGPAPLKALQRKKLIQVLTERADDQVPDAGPTVKDDDLELNAEQQIALDKIVGVMRSGEHRTVLLRGVTGSGKTEVYIQAIREVVHCGRQAIVLVPEISLTPQTIRRFRARFDSVAVLHSHLSDAERYRHWQQIARGEVQVVVGARSAIFAPTPKLGLIVIDEEHEPSFKQETVPRYHAREVARQRARLEGIPLVLGSATPMLESWRRSQTGQDLLVSLPHRIEWRPLPPVVVVDVRNDPQFARGGAIGRALEAAMHRALDAGGQVILFLNLRGYSPTLWCRSCGGIVRCPNCDITLTYHKDRQAALCHSCGHETSVSVCPTCRQPAILYLGTGTQRLEREVRAKFPGHACLRMDSDSMRRFGSHDAALEAFRKGQVRILLGTQMIAKGLDFPNVTLVGVVSADTILHQPDVRAQERTFQLISQVAGRTGRGPRGGRVYVQSTCPAEPAIRFAAEHDYLGFAAHELERRRAMLAPPYRHMARIILRGTVESDVRHQADHFTSVLAEAAKEQKSSIRILGPAPAPVAKLKGHYRYHLQLTDARMEEIHRLWRAASARFSHRRGVEHVIDVDPINMR
jgi:primosomal protein N' (replication factor Y)